MTTITVTLSVDAVDLLLDAISDHIDTLCENTHEDADEFLDEHLPAIQTLIDAANAIRPDTYTVTARELLDLDLADVDD